MPVKPPRFTDSRAAPARAGTPPRRRSLGWVRDVLSRSIRLEQRNKQLHVTLVDPKREREREREPEADKPMTLLMQQRAELGARLLVHDPATQAVRHLFVIHDELQGGGWERVQALPLKVIERALIEAEILAADEPSPMLATIVAELHDQKTTAEAKAAREAAEAEWEAPPMPEVSDTNFDEYELMERSWAGTIPAGLEIPARDTMM